jgi:hypothetical protein
MVQKESVAVPLSMAGPLPALMTSVSVLLEAVERAACWVA